MDRAYYPLGVGRQLVAIMAAGSRLEGLKRLRVPTLVVHGTDDILVPIRGRVVAAAVPGARFVEVQGMGHDLPPALWPQVIVAIVSNARSAAG